MFNTDAFVPSDIVPNKKWIRRSAGTLRPADGTPSVPSACRTCQASRGRFGSWLTERLQSADGRLKYACDSTEKSGDKLAQLIEEEHGGSEHAGTRDRAQVCRPPAAAPTGKMFERHGTRISRIRAICAAGAWKVRIDDQR